MAAIDIRSLNPNQLPGDAGDDSLDPTLSDVVGSPAADRLGAARSLLATDGVSLANPTHTVGQAAPGASNAPVLPDPEGPRASPSAASSLLANTTMYDTNLSAPISTAEAFNILQRSAMTGYLLSSAINRAANMNAIDAKKSEAANLMKQVEGERTHAAVTFGASVLAAVASIGVPLYGSGLSKGGKKAPEDAAIPTGGGAGAGAPGVGAAANLSAAATKPAQAAKVGKNGSAGKATDPNAPSNVPNPMAPAVDTTAVKRAQRDAKKLAQQQNAHAGPSSSPNPASGSSGANKNPADPTGTQAPNGVAKDDSKHDIISEAEQRKIHLGQAYVQAGPSVGAVITSGAELVDKTSTYGGQYQADVAKIAQKQDAIDAQVAEIAKDSSKSGQDQALEVLKAAQQLTQSYSQRWTEVNNNIANR